MGNTLWACLCHSVEERGQGQSRRAPGPRTSSPSSGRVVELLGRELRFDAGREAAQFLMAVAAGLPVKSGRGRCFELAGELAAVPVRLIAAIQCGDHVRGDSKTEGQQFRSQGIAASGSS